MKIYTKGGDKGETGLFGGTRVPKDDLRIRTYGTLDELNAVLGVVLAQAEPQKKLPADFQAKLRKIQNELFQLGAELATPRGKSPGIELVEDAQVTDLEKAIDAMEAELEPLKSFILPGGNVVASYIHLARTVARRAERELTTLHRSEPTRAVVLHYMNRLSDYLFVLARWVNKQSKIPDVPWVMRTKRA